MVGSVLYVVKYIVEGSLAVNVIDCAVLKVLPAGVAVTVGSVVSNV